MSENIWSHRRGDQIWAINMVPSPKATSSLGIAQLQWATSTMKRVAIWSHWNKNLLTMLVCLLLHFPPYHHPLVHKMPDLLAVCSIQHFLEARSLFMPKEVRQWIHMYRNCCSSYVYPQQEKLSKALWKVQLRHQLRIGCCPLGCEVRVDKYQIYDDALS